MQIKNHAIFKAEAESQQQDMLDDAQIEEDVPQEEEDATDLEQKVSTQSTVFVNFEDIDVDAIH